MRPDGRPHVTPLIAGWLDGALYFVTGPQEGKAMNLAANPHCVFTTGCNSWTEGLDIVVEGEAVRVRDDTRLRELQSLYDAKYVWHFDVRDDAFWVDGHEAYVFAVTPETAFGFSKGDNILDRIADSGQAVASAAKGVLYSQTRWRF